MSLGLHPKREFSYKYYTTPLRITVIVSDLYLFQLRKFNFLIYWKRRTDGTLEQVSTLNTGSDMSLKRRDWGGHGTKPDCSAKSAWALGVRRRHVNDADEAGAGISEECWSRTAVRANSQETS